jgi:hypothetical protein
MSNVTINIKNCTCCPGGVHVPGAGQSSGEGATGEWDVLGDPASPSGAPEGYSEPTGTLSDRQCKMAIWIYSWLQGNVDMLGNTTMGWTILTALRTGAGSLVVRAFLPYITSGAVFVLSLILTPGLDPGDAVVTAITFWVTTALISAVSAIQSEHITQPLFQDALPKIQNDQHNIICRLSQASNGLEAQQELSKVLATIGLSFEQQTLIKPFVPKAFLTMLFFTADWWPSFDDDVLTDITSTCCGDYVDGDPVVAESAQHCQSAFYIVNQLIGVFELTADALNTTYFDINPFYNDKADIFNSLKSTIAPPQKVQDLATNWTAYVTAVTEIFYSQTVIGAALIADPGYAGLADHLETNKLDLVDDLQAEADQADAFTLLNTDLAGWIDANVTDADHKMWMKASVEALITPKDGSDFMDLLFVQDSDLLGYASADCMAIEAEWPFAADAEGWVFAQISGVANGSWTADEGGSLEIELPSGSSGNGKWTLDVSGEGWVATVNTKMTAYFDGPTCASSDSAKIIYNDDTEDTVTIGTGTDVTIMVSASPGNFGKTLKTLHVQSLKGTNCAGNTLTHYVTSVELRV